MNKYPRISKQASFCCNNCYFPKYFPLFGLKDKNGKIIYFGDILIDDMNNLLTPVVEIENAEHILYFKPIKNIGKPSLKMGCKSTYSNTLEVIGNIFVNLEFLNNIYRANVQ